MNNKSPEITFSAFPAVMLIAASVAILLAWNLYQTSVARSNGIRVSAQQEIQLTQAVQTEEKLRLMMTDLVELAKSDADAKSIVTRYNITFNNPAPNQAPAPVSIPNAR